jgi:hypothetical protein
MTGRIGIFFHAGDLIHNKNSVLRTSDNYHCEIISWKSSTPFIILSFVMFLDCVVEAMVTDAVECTAP